MIKYFEKHNIKYEKIDAIDLIYIFMRSDNFNKIYGNRSIYKLLNGSYVKTNIRAYIATNDFCFDINKVDIIYNVMQITESNTRMNNGLYAWVESSRKIIDYSYNNNSPITFSPDRQSIKPLSKEDKSDYKKFLHGSIGESNVQRASSSRLKYETNGVKEIRFDNNINLKITPDFKLVNSSLFYFEIDPSEHIKTSPYFDNYIQGEVYFTSRDNNYDSFEIYRYDSLVLPKPLSFIFTSIKYASDINELNIFNTNKNEDVLMPFAKKQLSIINVYWKSVKDAFCYKVELYVYNERKYLHSLYFLSKKIYDHDTHYAIFDDLVSGGYIVRVSAEDRQGNIISLSRGISLQQENSYQYPSDWSFSNELK